jgi:hypothetical protein
MPTLEQAIVTFGKAHLNHASSWYQWRDINQATLPKGVVLPAGNHFTQNVALKVQLCSLYATANDDVKQALTRYYIVVWGGVKRNSPEKMKNYALASPADIILNGKKGIASWSKALCIRNPNEYAIYDARVAVSLNTIQVAYAVEEPRLFPLLVGQNKSINKGSKRILQHAGDNNWAVMQEEAFYQEYNRVLGVAAIQLGVQTYTLEMLLFSKPLELLGTAFPVERF